MMEMSFLVIFQNEFLCFNCNPLTMLLTLLILLVNRKCQTTQDTQLKHDEVFHHQNHVEKQKSFQWRRKMTRPCGNLQSKPAANIGRETEQGSKEQHDEVESLKLSSLRDTFRVHGEQT